MTDVSRALAQIEAIHDQLAKGEVYRGWKSVPVATSGVIGVIAALWQSSVARPLDPVAFTIYWLTIAGVALSIGCIEVAWHYLTHATSTDRRRARLVIGQFLPALVAGAIATGGLLRLSPALATIFPGLWALLFGVGIFAARPYLPRASGYVGLYYWFAGLLLLLRAGGLDTLSPWAVGGTFGIGQTLAAAVLYFSLERPAAAMFPAGRAVDIDGGDADEREV
jgi:hypothetical protein